MLMSKKQREELKELMEKADIPGISIASVINGVPSKPMALGFTDKSSRIPVTSETVFGAASLSKPVFAYLVLKVVQRPEFKFDLDQPLYKILEDKRLGGNEARKKLTARLVLSHKTGLPIWADESDRLLEFQFEPGEGYGYSGVAYVYLQKVIEIKTGLTLEALAKELVFVPLGMKHSSFYPPDDLTTAAVRNDEKMKTQPTPADTSKPPARAPSSLHTTASDYARFIAAWMSDDKLQDAFKCEVSMVEDKWAAGRGLSKEDLQKVAWGLGWGLQKTSQGKVTRAFHSGDMDEWRAFVAINLEDKMAIVYFANSCNGLILADKIISPTVDLEDGLKYIFEKYGFARKVEPDWKKKEIDRITKIIATYCPAQKKSDSYNED